MEQLEFNRMGYSLINSYIDKYKTNTITEDVDAFYHLVLDLFLSLDSTEREDSITDTNYNMSRDRGSGHDRGIDAIFIQDINGKKIIHFFNFKYKNSFESCQNHFSSREVDKICNFFETLYTKNISSFGEINQVLRDKIQEVISIMETSPDCKLKFHICSNSEKGLEESENIRLKENLKTKRIPLEYILGGNIISRLEKGERQEINAKLKFIGKEFFEKSDGDIKAIIVNVDVRDLLRLVIDNEELRDDSSIEDYEVMRNYDVLEDAFYDNVRVYQKQRGKINKNIKNTALDLEENGRFFYFNNGITITCDKIRFNPMQNSPIADIKNLQIVNGCQTINSLFEAFMQDPSKFENINILCKIYETENKNLSINIAEFTNSQNPVKNRDIHSVDYLQILLEKDLLARGYFYERKQKQYLGKPPEKRIDAEKAGQLLMSFYNELPAQAKNKKASIFSDLYEDIFNDSINSSSILLVKEIFEFIEQKKKEEKRRLIEMDSDEYQAESFILHSSLYLLYMIKIYSRINRIQINLENREDMLNYYDDAKNLLLEIVSEKMGEENYSHGALFKSPKLKEMIEEKLNLNNS